MNKLRKIAYPFSILYHGITAFRNWLYDVGFFESTSYEVPIISVGNLNVGGTGKSPMIEFLISTLKKEHKVAVLSRGYKRKTKGFQLVEKLHTAQDVGDEPLQFKLKFPEVTVAVDANRRRGIAQLKNKGGVILLDDAFQHRKVKPRFSIVLTAYSCLYSKDFLLPAGNLRESRKGAARAHCIVVTKCPPQLSEGEKKNIATNLQLKAHQKIYFSSIEYASTIISTEDEKPLEFLRDKNFTLVTGIANPAPLENFLLNKNFCFNHLEFSDHHFFTQQEIQHIDQAQIVLTTEKDFMRLKSKIKQARLYYLPIKLAFLEKEKLFVEDIKKAVRLN